MYIARSRFVVAPDVHSSKKYLFTGDHPLIELTSRRPATGVCRTSEGMFESLILDDPLPVPLSRTYCLVMISPPFSVKAMTFSKMQTVGVRNGFPASSRTVRKTPNHAATLTIVKAFDAFTRRESTAFEEFLVSLLISAICWLMRTVKKPRPKTAGSRTNRISRLVNSGPYCVGSRMDVAVSRTPKPTTLKELRERRYMAPNLPSPSG